MGWRTFAKIAVLITMFAAAGFLAGVLTNP
jgi:hypothetical protein